MSVENGQSMQSVFSQFSNNNQFSHQTIPVVSTFLAFHTFQPDTVHTAFSAAFARPATGADAFGQRRPLEAAMHTTSGRLRPASAPGSARFGAASVHLRPASALYAARFMPLGVPLRVGRLRAVRAACCRFAVCAGRMLSFRS